MAKRNYETLIDRLHNIAAKPNAQLLQIGEFEACGKSYPMFCVRIGKDASAKKRVMINAGIHGDEPGGVEAALAFMDRIATADGLRDRFDFTVLPCNNPTGWERNTRENVNGIDLNREFNAPKPAPEAGIISKTLQGKCFDLIFEMHEDVDCPGFYMYEIAEDPAAYIGEQIIEAAESIGCPINRDECIEGTPAANGLIRPKIAKFRKTRLPLAIFAWRTCGGHVITLEPVTGLSIEKRVQIQLIALTIALDSLAAAE